MALGAIIARKFAFCILKNNRIRQVLQLYTPNYINVFIEKSKKLKKKNKKKKTKKKKKKKQIRTN